MSDKIIVESPDGVKSEIHNQNGFWMAGHVESIDVVFYDTADFNIQQVIKAVKKEIEKIN